ncbi:MAG: hypothetical protein O7C73_07710 [Nitrospirae bacterium]|nr:hypothetical protein [Nitrospirota bacterium]
MGADDQAANRPAVRELPEALLVHFGKAVFLERQPMADTLDLVQFVVAQLAFLDAMRCARCAMI